MSLLKRAARVLCGAAFVQVLVGCAAGPPETMPERRAAAVVPSVAQQLASPIPSSLPVSGTAPSQRLYSLDVDAVPALQVLQSVAAQAGLTLQLRMRPTHKLRLTLVDQPLRGVLDAVVLDCACRYLLDDFTLRILEDAPYSRAYAVDYLNIDREIVANLAIATRVGNLSVASDSADNRGNASLTGLTSKSHFDLWQSIDAGLRSLLQLDSTDSKIQVNSAAGLVVVHARQREQRLAQRYLQTLQARMRRQVSIEAQVIEIDLDNSHAAGVDWRRLAQGEGLSWLQSLSGDFSATAQSSGSVLQYSGSDGSANTQLIVNLLQEFGDVRVISAPRVVALNNQPSVLSVVENKVYFSSSVKRQSSTDEVAVTESVETAIHTVPVGLVMQVTPQVAMDGEVVMGIRPTISRVSAYVNDPNPSLAEAGVRSAIPEIQVREMETVLRVSSGETVVLGGLMQLSNSESKQRVPWLYKLPLLGPLFSSLQRRSRQSELLVLLTPTVLSSESEW